MKIDKKRAISAFLGLNIGSIAVFIVDLFIRGQFSVNILIGCIILNTVISIAVGFFNPEKVFWSLKSSVASMKSRISKGVFIRNFIGGIIGITIFSVVCWLITNTFPLYTFLTIIISGFIFSTGYSIRADER